MQPILIVALVIVALGAAAVLVVLARRRRRAERDLAEQQARLQMSEAEIAFRLGLVDRPEVPLGLIPAAADLPPPQDAGPASPGDGELPAATAPGAAAGGDPAGVRGPVPDSRRYRLWRDSAAILLVTSLTLLALTTRANGLLGEPPATPTPRPTPTPTPVPVARLSLSIACVDSTTVRYTANTSGVRVERYLWHFDFRDNPGTKSVTWDFGGPTDVGSIVVVEVYFTNGVLKSDSGETPACS